MCPHGSGRVVLAAREQHAPAVPPRQGSRRGPRRTNGHLPARGASEVPAQPDFPELERRALAYWNAHETFRRASRTATTSSEFVFYDGPPFANGLPHYGHLLTGYVKDIVPRYKTMRGAKVDRRFGWDCHGLPAEVEAERQLGISGKADILKMGIETFNEACRDSVLRYTQRVAGVRHPPGPLGRLRQRLQDARPPLHGERHVGVQDSCTTRG